jgi:TonB family protein
MYAAAPKAHVIVGMIFGALVAQAAPAETPRCANPNREASVTNAMDPGDVPGLKAPVTVLVEVTIGPAGNLVNAMVYKSGGNIDVDRAAIRAARQSTYAPKLVNCFPTTGDYLFRGEFVPTGGTPRPSPTPFAGAPRFNPPADWQGSWWPTSPQGSWYKASFGVFTVRWAHDSRTLAQMHDDVLANDPLYGYQNVAGQYAKACGGTQDALRVSEDFGYRNHRDNLYITRGGMVYSISYQAQTGSQPDAAAQKALDSFCAP